MRNKHYNSHDVLLYLAHAANGRVCFHAQSGSLHWVTSSPTSPEQVLVGPPVTTNEFAQLALHVVQDTLVAKAAKLRTESEVLEEIRLWQRRYALALCEVLAIKPYSVVDLSGFWQLFQTSWTQHIVALADVMDVDLPEFTRKQEAQAQRRGLMIQLSPEDEKLLQELSEARKITPDELISRALETLKYWEGIH